MELQEQAAGDGHAAAGGAGRGEQPSGVGPRVPAGGAGWLSRKQGRHAQPARAVGAAAGSSPSPPLCPPCPPTNPAHHPQNNLRELWALLHFLHPDKFPDCEEFEDEYDVKDPESVRARAAALSVGGCLRGEAAWRLPRAGVHGARKAPAAAGRSVRPTLAHLGPQPRRVARPAARRWRACTPRCAPTCCAA